MITQTDFINVRGYDICPTCVTRLFRKHFDKMNLAEEDIRDVFNTTQKLNFDLGSLDNLKSTSCARPILGQDLVNKCAFVR